ncbi:MAG TPA: UDP-N-acetylmuramoyl-L-alanine--D-glutamate ligase [Clostridia bacterium]|nr:UDP-N-acetylmuramoyl-L-alanine--D-glutamate ligase [Clostridia bacterium]
MSQKVIDYIKNKKVLILGYGREGNSMLAFLRRFLPEKEFTVADCKEIKIDDAFVKVIWGEQYLSDINNYDLVIKSPGIPFIDVAVNKDTEITCQLDLFLRFFDVTTIGITGTKGKTTTSTLIYEMLKETHPKTELLGNIGVPVFNIKEETEIAVVEMSSHQLEFTKASPHVAVFVNIYEEHLDHYKNGFNGYVAAKLNIAKYQKENDYFIYNPEQKDDRVPPFIGITKGKIIEVPFTSAVKDSFITELQSLTPHLLGEHSKQNLGYAVAVSRIFGVSDNTIRNAVKGFNGIPHRLEYAGEYRGIRFYNDSIATIPKAVINAIKSVENVDTLIFGGLDRGIDYTEFIRFLSEGQLKVLIGLPETGHTIIDALVKGGYKGTLYKADDMEEAVKLSYKSTKEGSACLFSPAAASYNKYKDFEEKGNHFKQCIREMRDN